MPISVVFLIVIISGLAEAVTVKYSAEITTDYGEPCMALTYSASSSVLTSYTRTKVIKNNNRAGVPALPHHQVTGVAEEEGVGIAEIEYRDRCITYRALDGAQYSIGQCNGRKVNVTVADITPYGVTFGSRGEIAFTDTAHNSLKIWNPVSGELRTLVSDSQLLQPRGIVYDVSIDSYYITISNGVYSTKQRRVVAGDVGEKSSGMVDGTLKKSRFNYPVGIALMRPGILAVADHLNNRIRLVDMIRGEVTSLCSENAKCGNIVLPISLTANGDLSKLFVGDTQGLKTYNLLGPRNLCYGVQTSGHQTITVSGVSMKVSCDVDSPDGPWINMMSRFDGSKDFKQSYADYVTGFGDLSAEHWLGLENIYLLTKNRKATLRIDLEAFKPPVNKGKMAYALYTKFWLGNSTSGYRLDEMAGYSGNAGDMETTEVALRGGPHKGQMFSAYDNDADSSSLNCAADLNGGWWFKDCYTVCLTCGPYRTKPRGNYATAMVYFPFTMKKQSLKSASMKIKLPQELLWDA